MQFHDKLFSLILIVDRDGLLPRNNHNITNIPIIEYKWFNKICSSQIVLKNDKQKGSGTTGRCVNG